MNLNIFICATTKLYFFVVVTGMLADVVSCVVTDATERNFNAVFDSSSEFSFYMQKN